MNLLREEDSNLDKIAKTISKDPAIAARMLQQASSAMYASRSTPKSVAQAIQRLGLKKVKTIAMTAATQKYLGVVVRIPEVQACWKHSLASAILAEDLSRVWGFAPEVGYMMGLLHDLGRLALAVSKDSRYPEFLRTEYTGLDPLDHEREWFGTDHTEIGREIALECNWSEEVVQAAGRHHDHRETTNMDVLLVTQTACRLASSFGYAAVPTNRQPDDVLNVLSEQERQGLPTDTNAWKAFVEERITAFG